MATEILPTAGPASREDATSTSTPLGLTRHFTTPAVHPYDEIEWELRTANIASEGGGTVFEQKDIEIPASWSQLATNVVASKYFRGALGAPERERSVRQIIDRVAKTIRRWGIEEGYFASDSEAETFEVELTHLLVRQKVAFNSPVWFNVGLTENPQCSACFILSVDDDMSSILEWISKEGRIFKGGSGSGVNLSRLRSSTERLSAGGTASGPVSFMRGADSCAGAIKSGGTTRRAAKMVILNCDHPDILEFVNCKANEEKKAWALGEMGYDMGLNGEAWHSIQFQNANNSVRVTDEFMYAVEGNADWHTKAITSGETIATMRARDLMRAISEAAWVCGDPGMQFDTTINRWHTCPVSGRINASNPCSEYMHLDDSACNLASLNLMHFVDEGGTFLLDDFRQAVDVIITAMDIVVARSGYPTEEITRNARNYRQLGLGYANLGALLMSHGLPYDSDQGRAYAGAITALMTGRAYEMSTRLAERMGPFQGYANNAQPMQGVIRMHQRAAKALSDDLVLDRGVLDAARESWDGAAARGEVHGFRNSQATVLAPTGTIGFMMDCDTTGVEPDIALVKYKRLVGGGVMKIVNQTVPQALTKLGYDADEVRKINDFIDEHETIEGAPGLKDEHLAVFDCAFPPLNGERLIHYKGHIKMMGAVQPFISGAISKTVNMANDATPEDIAAAYMLAWKEGVKALAIYRDGSKRTQPLSTGKSGDNAANASAASTPAAAAARPTRRRMPDTREAITHHFSIADHDGYITVGKYEDGSPGEIFMKMAKQGSTVSGLIDSLAIMMSLALQYGVPIQIVADKLSHMRFDPSGFTKNPDIPMAKSIVDYIVRWLSSQFLSEDEKRQVGVITPNLRAEAAQAADDEIEASISKASGAVEAPAKANGNGHAHNPGQVEFALPPGQGGAFAFKVDQDGALCGSCGWTMIRSGSCYKCMNCGSTSGCS
jgi:ribonucleoside-diphosphate reductase alpha chain